MNIAIIGAGFCGLSLAHFLLQFGGCQVTIFDPKGIGGGASGVATGLLHPYTGEQGKRSWRATEAIAATIGLLKQVEKVTGCAVASYEGILRIMQDDPHKKTFVDHIERYGDVVQQEDEYSFLITSGVTVHCQSYLQGLGKMIENAGGTLKLQHIGTLAELDAYDHVILAAGGGIVGFSESEQLHFRRTKGQVLTVEVPSHCQPLQRSVIARGYLAKGDSPDICYLGSTYERPFVSEEPDWDVAKEKILPNAPLFFPMPICCASLIADLGSGLPGWPLPSYYRPLFPNELGA